MYWSCYKMKRLMWQAPLVMILIFILSISLPYLVLDSNEGSETKSETLRMSIALVNEDDGGIFNDESIEFGDEFVKSVVKDDDHDWYVVSRGVAESGYERNAYEMMIVIPNNFSENSLSMNEMSPERVVLSYKINATGHEDVRAEAEKVAGEILSDFNRKLIDVYFASIIGNLQEAQDNITEIIEKEQNLTNLYSEHIKSPLANYTTQFESIQNQSNLSRESYLNTKDQFIDFEQELETAYNQQKELLSEIENTIDKKEAADASIKGFSETLDEQVARQKNNELLNQLNQLATKNTNIYNQFVRDDSQEEVRSIITQTKRLERYFTNLKVDAEEFDEALNQRINTDLKKIVSNAISDSFKSEESSENNDFSVGELLGLSLEKVLKRRMNASIRELPTLNIEDIEESGLSEEIVQDLKNIILFTKKYREENRTSFIPLGNRKKLLSSKIELLKENLTEEGISVEDSMQLFPYDSEEQYFYLKVPKNFGVHGLSLTVGDEERSFTADELVYDGSRKIEFPLTDHFVLEEKQELLVKVHFKLEIQAELNEIDLFAPLVWQWDVAQQGMEELLEEEEILDDYTQDDLFALILSDVGCLEGTEEQCPDNIEKEKDESNDTSTDDEQKEKDENDENEEEKDENDENEEEKDDEQEVEIITKTERILMKNYYMNHQVHSKLIDNPEATLIKSVPDMVVDYYQLLSLYEIYYGFDFGDQQALEKIFEQEDRPLSEQAKENSVYGYFHDMNITDVLKDFVVDTVKENVIAEVLDKYALDDLAKKLKEYNNLLEDAFNSSGRLAEVVMSTSDEAIELNNNVSDLLEELTSWRETNESLLNEQIKIIEQSDETSLAVMNLDAGYQPLLMASESLANQAQNNTDSADTVYDTLEQIDKEADTIKESGDTLVNQASDLANKLTDKAIDDLAFAGNFQELLANSRIGDRQNDDLYDFLSSPVMTQNDGVIKERESFVAYFLVIIITIGTLFTSYAISSFKLKQGQEEAFEEAGNIFQKNLPSMFLTVGVGAIQGIVIGVVSSYLLTIERPVLWIAILTGLMMALVLLSTYLLRQFKMLGMFIILTVVGLYLFVTKTLGFNYKYTEMMSNLRKLSPLQHVETLLSDLLESTGNIAEYTVPLVLLVTCVALGVLLNLVVWNKKTQAKRTEENEVETI